MELRCKGKLHGIVVIEDTESHAVVEFKCRSRWCGAGKNRVVLHRFNIRNGQYITRRYSDPVIKKGDG